MYITLHYIRKLFIVA